MENKISYIERIIAFLGSVVSILGFSGLSVYAIINNFKELAPNIGIKLIYTSLALIGSIVMGVFTLVFIGGILQIFFKGFRIHDKNGNIKELETARFHDIKTKFYVSISFVCAILIFIGCLLLIWSDNFNYAHLL